MGKDSRKTIVYSALEVANICGVVNQTAINWIRNGYLKAFSTPGGQYRVYQDDLIEFMMKRHMRIPSDLVVEDKGDSAGTILIVDDDKGLNNVMAKYLTGKFPDFSICQAFDGFEAGVQFVEKKPDLVLLDLNLPGLDGFSLCSRINDSDEFGKPLVFIITSLNDEGLEEKVKKMGAKEFYRKPLNLVEVAGAIRKTLNIL
ncbi:MAG: response regulator [Treponemataceae bacterium]|nr:response regulator [Treponemataceae bacterium]